MTRVGVQLTRAMLSRYMALHPQGRAPELLGEVGRVEAAEGDRAVTTADLLEAARLEYREMGRII